MRGVLVDSLVVSNEGRTGAWFASIPGSTNPTRFEPSRSTRLRLRPISSRGDRNPTQAIVERFEEGDDIDVLARDFELDVAKVQQALRWEQRAARAV
jgi:hypothetical protein